MTAAIRTSRRAPIETPRPFHRSMIDSRAAKRDEFLRILELHAHPRKYSCRTRWQRLD
jgi:hypothetical protein